MRVVWKMALEQKTSVTEFELPEGAEFLSGMLQPGPMGTPQAILFALVDPDARLQKRRVFAAITSEEIDDAQADSMRHIATMQAITPGGQVIVVHVFEVLS